MATVDSVRTLLETFEAYEEKDFDRLAELYAEDVVWDGTEPGPRDCKNREDVFGMFRVRMRRGGEATFHQILSIGPRVLLVGDMEGGRFVSVFTVEGGRIVHVQDFESTGAALDTLKRPPS
jgi:ketosteroid isomerase-like protein